MYFFKNKRIIGKNNILKSKQQIYLENLKKKQDEENLVLKENIEQQQKKEEENIINEFLRNRDTYLKNMEKIEKEQELKNKKQKREINKKENKLTKNKEINKKKVIRFHKIGEKNKQLQEEKIKNKIKKNIEEENNKIRITSKIKNIKEEKLLKFKSFKEKYVIKEKELLKKREEELKKREEEIKKREEELKKREEEMKKKEQEINNKKIEKEKKKNLKKKIIRFFPINKKRIKENHSVLTNFINILKEDYCYIIQTTHNLLTISTCLKKLLKSYGLNVKVMLKNEIEKSILKNDKNNYYIFLWIQELNILPKENYIIYNLEPITRYKKFPDFELEHLNPKIVLEGYNNCDVILDYSKTNINKYPEKLKKKGIYFPIPFLDGANKINYLYNNEISFKDREIDILFFGSLNERRNKISEELNEMTDLNIEFVYNVFGEKLYEKIRNSKIVLNLHFDKTSILETARLHDCLRKHDVFIISEKSCNEDREIIKFYNKLVEFIQVIDENKEGGLNILIEKIYKIIYLIENNDNIDNDVHNDNNFKRRQEKIKNVLELNKNINSNYIFFDHFERKSIVFYNLNNKDANENIFKKYKYLFHKYHLKLSNPNDKINYILKLNYLSNENKSNKLLCHLHCYDISKFDIFYSKYIEKIYKYFNVIITYSIGDKKFDLSVFKNNDKYVILKIPNRGMDIGAKMCMVQYLKDIRYEYSYILFLHSKTDQKQREKYFNGILDYVNDGFINELNNQNSVFVYDGYFPNIEWEIQGDKLKMISGNSEYDNSNLPERNLLYRNKLLGYLNCVNKTNRFIEGNVYILSKKVIEKVFGDLYLYNILNTQTSFDYNWICKTYDLIGSIEEVYDEYKEKKLEPRNNMSYDGYIEHVFERIILNCCDNYLILKKKVLDINFFINDIYEKLAFCYIFGIFIQINDIPKSNSFKELYNKITNIKSKNNYKRIFCSNGLGDFIITSNIINLNDYEFIYIASTRVKIIQKYINYYYPHIKVININDGVTYFSMNEWLQKHKNNKYYYIILNNCIDISIRVIFKMINLYYTILNKNSWISDNNISYNHPAFNIMRCLINNVNFINKDKIYNIHKLPNILKNKKYPIDLKKFNLENLTDYYIIFPYTGDNAIDCPKCAHIHKKVDYCSYYRNFTREDWIGVENYLLKKKTKGIILGVEDDFFPNNKIFLNLNKKTNLFESIELLRKSKGYIGIDSWLSIISKMFNLEYIKIKSVNTNALLNYRCYWKDDTFIRKNRCNNFINLL